VEIEHPVSCRYTPAFHAHGLQAATMKGPVSVPRGMVDKVSGPRDGSCTPTIYR
jgi:hypothetical protein